MDGAAVKHKLSEGFLIALVNLATSGLIKGEHMKFFKIDDDEEWDDDDFEDEEWEEDDEE